jgi:hypothetical protein
MLCIVRDIYFMSGNSLGTALLMDGKCTVRWISKESFYGVMDVSLVCSF